MSKVAYVFFSDEIGFGGISTNVIALAQYVSYCGNRPIIVPIKKGKNKTLKLYSVFLDVLRPAAALKILLCSKNTSFVIFTNSARTLLLGFSYFLLLRLNKINVKVLFAVYNPWEFSQSGIWQKFYRLMISELGSKNIFFMNGGCLEHHQNAHSSIYFDNFLPLVKPEITEDTEQIVSRESNCILTVARFVGFKMHYLRELIHYAKVHPEVTVNIVGYGEGDKELKNLVRVNGVININFLGMIDNYSLTKLYRSASCYVGMGTTLIEASSCGTPSIVAVAGVPGHVCYGYFTDQLDYDMGEYRRRKKLLVLSDLLDEFFLLPPTYRHDLELQHKAFAGNFSLTQIGNIYDKLVFNAESNFIEARGFLVYVIFSILTAAYWAYTVIRGTKSRYDRPYG